jgi:hypothetical protein
MAHADMFISDHAKELVFDPLADWLRQHRAPSTVIEQ